MLQPPGYRLSSACRPHTSFRVFLHARVVSVRTTLWPLFRCTQEKSSHLQVIAAEILVHRLGMLKNVSGVGVFAGYDHTNNSSWFPPDREVSIPDEEVSTTVLQSSPRGPLLAPIAETAGFKARRLYKRNVHAMYLKMTSQRSCNDDELANHKQRITYLPSVR